LSPQTPSVRPLTPAERSLAGEVFGVGLDAVRIRLLTVPLWPRAFVAGSALIVWPAATAMADFTLGPLWAQATLVHELTHIWQAQRGVFLPFAKLKAGDSAAAYAYDLVAGPAFRDLNIEQQASVVEHAFLASRGAPTPFAAELYVAMAPEWRSV
jgi:hypothetical protein